MSVWAPCDFQRKAIRINSGAIIFKSKHVGRHFCSDFQGILKDSQRFCPGFEGSFPDFMGFCPDFHQIETFTGAIAPLHPRLLHQWSWQITLLLANTM